MTQQTCNPDRLDAFLRGDLRPKAESELILHLDDCGGCRESLQRRAGEKAMWQEATDMLTGWRIHRACGDRAESPPRETEIGNTPPDAEARAFNLQLSRVQDALAPTDDPYMLGRLGPYEVSAIVGSGAMGVVLKALDRSLDRVVAIKVMAPHLASCGSARQRFAREAKAAAAVMHPNVIAIHGVSNDGALPYLVMPYSRGESLQKRLDREGPLPVGEVLRIGSQVAAGLAAAHAQGLVHRDIKPANILLEEGVERVAITDFGLARAVDDATMTRSGVIAGTPQYMSPEQARGETIDASSDLFSLGSLLYALCTGRAPFRAETTFGVLQRINGDAPRPIREISADVPDWLCRIIEKLMAKEPAGRFESAESVAALLEDCLAHVQQPDAAELPQGISKFAPTADAGRKRLRILAAVISAFALIGLSAAAVADRPTDITGTWTGENWSSVELREIRSGVYEGDCRLPIAALADSAAEPKTGSVRVKWSHLFNRYTGSVSEGGNRYCRITLRRVGGEVRGAWTARNAPAIDFTWTQLVAEKDNERVGQYYRDDTSPNQRGPGMRPPEPKVQTATYWKRDFASKQGAQVALARDGRIAIATAVEKRTGDPMRGVDGVVFQRVIELLGADRMGETLPFEIDHSLPFDATRSLVFSPDGKYLALGTDNGLVAIFDSHTRNRVQLLSTPRTMEGTNDDEDRGMLTRVTSLAFSRDGRFLAACGDRLDAKERLAKRRFANGDSGVRVWDLETGRVNYDLDDLYIATDVAFSPDGKFLVCSGSWLEGESKQTGFISVNALTGARVMQNATVANGGTQFVAYSSNGQVLTGEHVFDNQNRTTIRRWTERPLQHTISGNATQAEFTADGSLIAVLCNGRTVRFLNSKSMRQVHEIALDTDVHWSGMSIGAQPQRFVVTGYYKSETGKVRVELWSFRTKQLGSNARDEQSSAERPPKAAKESSPKETPKAAEDDAALNSVEGIDTATGSRLIQECLKRRNLVIVKTREYELEHRFGISQQLYFDGKGGRVRVAHPMNRIFALSQPTKQLKFELGVTGGPKSRSTVRRPNITFYVRTPEFVDSIHVDWRDQGKCIVAFYGPQLHAKVRREYPVQRFPVQQVERTVRQLLQQPGHPQEIQISGVEGKRLIIEATPEQHALVQSLLEAMGVKLAPPKQLDEHSPGLTRKELELAVSTAEAKVREKEKTLANVHRLIVKGYKSKGSDQAAKLEVEAAQLELEQSQNRLAKYEASQRNERSPTR